jgi:hypothetical protein
MIVFGVVLLREPREETSSRAIGELSGAGLDAQRALAP